MDPQPAIDASTLWLLGGALGALWVVTMALAANWGKRIDRRLASIDEHLTKAARFEGAVEAKLDSHDKRTTRLEGRVDNLERDVNGAMAR
jgi:hypothetical protein